MLSTLERQIELEQKANDELLPAEAAIEEPRLAWLDQAIGNLDPESQWLLRQFYFEKRSPQSLSAELGKSAKAIESDGLDLFLSRDPEPPPKSVRPPSPRFDRKRPNRERSRQSMTSSYWPLFHRIPAPWRR